MTIFHMMASLVLGLTAWGLAVAALRGRAVKALTGGSWLACGLALLFQLREIDYLANVKGDISAIMDTIPAVVLVGTVLLMGTAVLNLVVLFQTRKA